MNLNELAVTKVASVTGVDMQTVAKNILYTVPVGKSFIPVAVVVRDGSDSLAGGNDYDIGAGANCDTWRQTVDLSSMTTSGTDFMVVTGADVTKYTKCVAGDEFGIKPITGSTAAATATIDVFGYLV